MNLDTAPAERHAWRGEFNLLSNKYFPNEDRRWFEIEIVHGPLYKSTCNSCQAGVNGIKQAFDYLLGGSIVWNQNIVAQDQSQVVIQIESYRRVFTLGSEKVCVIPVEPTLENVAGWFHTQFKGQLELAHTNIMNFTCEGETRHMLLGY